MKKFLSIFAFAMMAVCSLSLVSCGDDDNDSGKAEDTTVTAKITSTVIPASGVENVRDNAINAVLELLKSKLGSYATFYIGSEVYAGETVRDIYIKVNSGVTADQFKAAAETVTSDMLKTVMDGVNGLDSYTFTFTVNGDAVRYYEYLNDSRYLTSMPTGTWKATVNNKTCTITITDTEVATDAYSHHKCYKATVVYGDTTFENGYAYIHGSSMVDDVIYISEDSTSPSFAIDLEFENGSKDISTAIGLVTDRISGEKMQYDDIVFTKQ